MRTYRKAWRSKDFKIILTEIPPGLNIEDFEQVCVILDYRVGPERPPAAPGSIPTPHGNLWFAQLYNRIAAPANWVAFNGDGSLTWTGFDGDGNPVASLGAVGQLVDGASGLDLANHMFDVRSYDQHPEN